MKEEVEEQMRQSKVKFKITKCLRASEEVTFFYNVAGSQEQLINFTRALLAIREVKSFEE